MHIVTRRRIIGSPSPSRLRSNLPLQVAAVCYRWRGDALEFLLVQTLGSNPKWTFPKGAPSRSMPDWEAAAREAREEAGAIGRIEHRHFHHYVHSKRSAVRQADTQEFLVRAFLLEVRRTTSPQEFRRNPEWFRDDDAREALGEGRAAKYSAELLQVYA